MRANKELSRVLKAAWRRRYVLILPVLIMIPLSLGAALLLPQKFVARALILFQEADPENPLTSRSSQAVSERMQDRIAGMRALMKSENVLNKVIDELNGGRPLSPAERIDRLVRLQSTLELDNVGNNLLEFRLAGYPAAGLGEQLETVLKHFLDGYRAASPYRTPERIVAIDRPTDPVRPVRGRMIVLITGIAGGILIGVAIAVLLEMTDGAIRTADELQTATGLPIVSRVPEMGWADGRKLDEFG